MERTAILIVLLSLCHRAFSLGNLEVLYSPESLIFKNTNQPLLNSDYSKFVSLSLAYSTTKPSDWDGFYGYKNFANIPQSVVTFHVPISLKSIATHVYHLDENSDIETEYSTISRLMNSKYANTFSDKVVLFKNKADSLQDQLDNLNTYIAKLQDLKSKNQLQQRMSLWFDFAAPSKVEEQTAIKFQEQIQEAVEKFRLLFENKAIIISIDNKDFQTHNRAARQANPPEEQGDYNLAYAYDADFHTAFATIGFTTILLLLAVFGVSVAMWNIDPGRDSIIYRLTSQKMKKDQ